MPKPLVQKIIHDAGEVPLVLHSDAAEPISGQTFLRRALVLAELAMISYNDPAEAQRAAEAIGFLSAKLIEHDGAQAYLFVNEHDVVVACRGTEPTEWNDVRADANAVLSVVGTLGKVHSGFNREVDDLWPVLEEILRNNKQPVWFCGHSLGGAMATICSFRCKASSISSNPQELHTFGSPRVGCRKYTRHAEVAHYRWVHNNDVVTRCPPVWWGYRHCGQEVYLDRYGRIRPLTGIWRSRDRWRGFVSALMKWKFDLLDDHSVLLYAQHIVTAINAEIAGQQQGKAAIAAKDLVIRVDEEEESCKPAKPQSTSAALNK
jgi:triacylglycerol lipase